ncbi:MAG TPA: hypothetical protein VN688_29400 [Gemmataceae bacterium]|nr:hypothetical protein [Gemmataceae bacterium]
MPANPFEILRLDPSATEEEIVRQAGRLRQRVTDEANLNAIRQAVQMLTACSEDRLLHSLLTHPAPCHHWPALDRFVAAFRRPPVATNAPPPCPSLDMVEFSDLIKNLVAEELELPMLPFEPIAADETPEEISRQTAEILWQSLLFDPGA